MDEFPQGEVAMQSGRSDKQIEVGPGRSLSPERRTEFSEPKTDLVRERKTRKAGYLLADCFE